jgi:prepilin-type processing-associated H-X9-DG protein
MTDNSVAGGVMICPDDLPDAIRSYSMNLYASSYVSSYVRADLDGPNPPGKLFKFGTGHSSEVILLADSWSELAQPENNPTPTGYAAEAVMGYTGNPGRRFGAAGGIGWSQGRLGTKDSQIAFYRHRSGRNRSMTDPDGAANFAFADGHVALHASRDLADFETGKSRYRALWSTIDPDLERDPAP